ncbi:MAG: 2',3'-cyclic-nucleotide 2'-phosphodiesterase (5'-nucleotidase family) [Cyclobacteriaceae bacterium]|jgi:2',3'-cyclic-nucleotide 2'-phosphodiesterase (5'-nucleotidase family)
MMLTNNRLWPTRSRRLLAALSLAFLLTALALPVAAEKRQLVIIHTNDFHGHIQQTDEYAGAARIAALVNETRAKNPGVLVLNAGDSISGTPVSTLFEGLPIFEVLNKIGYNASALGNHEFDHGYKQIELFRDIANYPLISANAQGPNGELIADDDNLVMQVNGIRVGIIGLITDNTPNMITPTGNENLTFGEPEAVLRAQVEKLDPFVDLVVVLSHVGHDEERALAAAVDNIDIIVGGHSHTRVDPPVKINNTYVVQANHYGADVGYLNIEVDTTSHSMTQFNGHLIAANDLPEPDPSVAALVNHWEQQVAKVVDHPISIATRDYTKGELQIFFEDLIAEETGADFGFYNMGGIRDRIRQGTVTMRTIWQIEPFGNSLVTVTAPGIVIKTMLTMDDERHHRLGEIDDETVYRVATNGFVSAQLNRAAPGQITVEESQELIRDVLIRLIRDDGIGITSPSATQD